MTEYTRPDVVAFDKSGNEIAREPSRYGYVLDQMDAFALMPGARRVVCGDCEQDVIPSQSALIRRYGASAWTTYDVCRRWGMGAAAALAVCRAQVAALGAAYPGGLACLPWRNTPLHAIALPDVLIYLASLPSPAERDAADTALQLARAAMTAIHDVSFRAREQWPLDAMRRAPLTEYVNECGRAYDKARASYKAGDFKAVARHAEAAKTALKDARRYVKSA